MRSGQDVRYADAGPKANPVGANGARIPFAPPLTPWKSKQTHREKDIPDRLFLRQILAAQGIKVETSPAPARPTGLRAWNELDAQGHLARGVGGATQAGARFNKPVRGNRCSPTRAPRSRASDHFVWRTQSGSRSLSNRHARQPEFSVPRGPLLPPVSSFRYSHSEPKRIDV